jgi:hypothetical protein
MKVIIVSIFDKHEDFIAMDGVAFLIHFKSSNWCPWYTEEYVTDKKIAMTKMLGDL